MWDRVASGGPWSRRRNTYRCRSPHDRESERGWPSLAIPSGDGARSSGLDEDPHSGVVNAMTRPSAAPGSGESFATTGQGGDRGAEFRDPMFIPMARLSEVSKVSDVHKDVP